MQLSLTKVERCEKLLTSSIALAAANAGPRSSIYNRPQNRFSEFNETIWECHDNYYLDAATLSHLLQFGTVIRRGEGRLVSLAAGIFTALKTLLAKKETDQGLYRYVVFSGVGRALEFPEFRNLGQSLVWPDEQQKITEMMAEYNDVELSQIDIFKEGNFRKFEIFKLAGHVPAGFWENIEELWSLANSGEPATSEVAKAALFYLVEKNDVVDDGLGFFGLVDDIEAIRLSLRQLRPGLIAEELLEEFLSIDGGLSSLLLGRETETQISFNSLVGLCKPILLSLSSINYLKAAGRKRILSVWPDNSFALVSQLTGFLLESKKTGKFSSERLPQTGATIYFNLPKISIATRFLGLSENIPNTIELSDVINSKSSNYSCRVPIYAVPFATKVPKNKTVVEDASKLQKWLKMEQSFVPPHLNFGAGEYEHIFILTRRNKFDEQIRQFKPFDVPIGELVDFDYETATGARALLMTSETTLKRPLVRVFSSSDVMMEAIDSIEEDYSKTIVLCDDESLASNFLPELSEAWGHDKLQVILFANSYQENFIKECAKQDFAVCSMQHHFEDFEVDGRLEAQQDELGHFTDAVSQFERKTVKSNTPPRTRFMPVESLALDELLRASRDLWQEVSDGRAYSLELQNISKRLLKEITSTWMARSSEKHDALNNLILEAEQILEAEAYLGAAEKLAELLKNYRHEYLNLPRIRGVENFLRMNREQHFAVLVESEPEAHSANLKFKEIGIDNGTAFGERGLKGRYLELPLIVPFLPSPRKSSALASSSASNELVLFFSEYEKEKFELRKEKIKLGNSTLARLNTASFTATPVQVSFRKFESANIPKKKEIPPEISDLIEKTLQSRISAFSKDSGDTTFALPIYFDDSAGMVFLAPGSSVFIQKGNEFITASARGLSDGDRFCIPMDSKSDMLDELASLGQSGYREVKNTATEWKDKLRHLLRNHLENNILQLKNCLALEGIERGEQSIRNWLQDSSLIAPKDPNEVFEKFTKLPGFGDAWHATLGARLDAVRKCYSARRDAGEKILSIINSENSEVGAGREMKVRFGQSELLFKIVEVSFVGQPMEIDVDELWKPQTI